MGLKPLQASAVTEWLFERLSHPDKLSRILGDGPPPAASSTSAKLTSSPSLGASLVLSRSDFLRVVRAALEHADFRTPRIVSDFRIACDVTDHRHCYTILLGGTSGCGKCLAVGTPVLVAGLRRVPVERLAVGDRVCKPDGSLDDVVAVCAGVEAMYRVVPRRGVSDEACDEDRGFTCNGSHVLRCHLPRDDALRVEGCDVVVYVQDAAAVDPVSGLPHRIVAVRRPMPSPMDAVSERARLLAAAPPLVSFLVAVADLYTLSSGVDAYLAARLRQYSCAPLLDECGSGTDVFAGRECADAALNSGCVSEDAVQLLRKLYAASLRERIAFVCGAARAAGGRVATCSAEAARWLVRVARSAGHGALAAANGSVVLLCGGHASREAAAACDLCTFACVCEPLGIGSYAGFTLRRDPNFVLGNFTVTHNSTLASLLAARLGFTTVISTDNVRHMIRSMTTKSESHPVLWASTYHAGDVLPDGDSVGLTEPERVLRGYMQQSDIVFVALERLIAGCSARHENMVVEGVHLDTPLVQRLQARFPNVIPFIIYISNENKHKERFAIRSKYMTLDSKHNQYVKYFHNIRLISDHVTQAAREALIPLVDNTNVDRSLAAIHATVFASICRLVQDDLPRPEARAAAIQEEYERVQLRLWSSKTALRVIRSRSKIDLQQLLDHGSAESGADGLGSDGYPVAAARSPEPAAAASPRESLHLDLRSALPGAVLPDCDDDLDRLILDDDDSIGS